MVPDNEEVAKEEADHLFAGADDDHDDFLRLGKMMSLIFLHLINENIHFKISVNKIPHCQANDVEFFFAHVASLNNILSFFHLPQFFDLR